MDCQRSDTTAVTTVEAIGRAEDRSHDWLGRLGWVVVAIAIFLRLLRYYQGRSLWLDEVFLANNLIHRSAWELLGRLDYRQGAPPLFLMLCKGAISLFGHSEYALRLVPLLAGLISVPLFYLLARRLLQPTGALIGIAIFAVLEPLIYYSSEVKQYSMDVLVAVAILLAIIWLRDDVAWASRPWPFLQKCMGETAMLRNFRATSARVLIMFAVGVLGIFLSYPAIFMLIGGWIWLRGTLQSPRLVLRVGRQRMPPPHPSPGVPWERERSVSPRFIPHSLSSDEKVNIRPARRKIDIMLIGWLIVFAVNYLVFLRPLTANAGLQNYWASAYPSASFAIFGWLWQRCVIVFTGYDTMWLRFNHVGVGPAYAAMILAAAGVAFGLKYHRGLVIWPIALALLAAALHKYPFDDRLILFLVPLFILMIAAGVTAAWNYRATGIVATGLLALVVIPAAARATIFAIHPPGREEIKPALAYLQKHWRAGDMLYVYHAADAPFLYYRDQFGLSDAPFIQGHRPDKASHAFSQDLRALTGHHRVWVLFSHVLNTPTGDERHELLDRLRRHGTEMHHFSATGAWVYLFNFEIRNPRSESNSPSEKYVSASQRGAAHRR